MFCVLTICLSSLAAVATARAPGRAASRLALVQPGQGGSGQTGGGGSSSPALATATLEQCLTASDQLERSATFNGQMNAVTGTNRMAIQIVVQEEGPGEATFHTLAAAGLGGWKRSETGVKIYKYVRQVTDLPAPGAFRAVVQFRWMNEKGRIIKRAARRTPVCVQPDERAKLVVAQMQVQPLRGSEEALYEVVVRNDGHSAAGAFGVALSVNGIVQPPMSVASLGPGAHTVLNAKGPRCTAGGTVEVVLDPQHQVAEALGGGESDTLPCPLEADSVTSS